ncbi:hypothetical protein Krac_7454 [Ktedonobacter racemifer DSM 44963]|uniref:Uncharacterized protein n=1 Tax=Ktedonobacter racemifer DSM 44963 TaxID=485913 RepID=D6TK69_KTERA|nr:hypothetical protein Krac_7454 [Ktedonobacter racemifer DSM 44963]
MIWPPMHSRSFEARLHDQLVGTFYHPRPNGPACGLVGWILHTRLAFVQVGQIFCDGAHREQRTCQPSQPAQHWSRATMFEQVQTASEGLKGQGVPRLGHALKNRTDAGIVNLVTYLNNVLE